MHKSFSLAAPLLAIILAGCAGAPVEEIRSTLARARSCCTSAAQLPSSPMRLGVRESFELSTSSPIFDTPKGLAYVLSFTLPEGATRLAVESKSTAYLPKATYVDPGLIFVDGGGKIVAESQQLTLRNRAHMFLGLPDPYYGAEVDIPADARSVVVYGNVSAGRYQQAVSDNGMLWRVPPAQVGKLAFTAR